MKKLLGAALLAVPFLVVSAEARASDCCMASGSCGPSPGLCIPCWLKRLWPAGGCCEGYNPLNVRGCLAGPWYSYWPYEAHFMTAAPVTGAYPFGCNYPYWPTGGGYSYPGYGSPGYGNPGYGYPASPTDYYSHAPYGPAAPAMPGMGYPAGNFMQANPYLAGR